MKTELEEDLRQITQVIYCQIGTEKIEQFIKLIKPFCIGKESKEILKVIKNEKKLIDKIFEKFYELNQEYIVSEEQMKEVIKKIK